MNTGKSLTIVAAAALVMLALAVGLTQAQGPGPGEAQFQTEAEAATITPGAIPIQGRLTAANGRPLSGTYSITFRVYDAQDAATPLCSDNNAVKVENGLFSSYVDNCYNQIGGQKLWLGVEVEGDGEMLPRQVIYSVPYALSLRPGAVISGSGSYDMLTVRNRGSGVGIYGIGMPGVLGESSGWGHGIVGRAGIFGAGVKGEGNLLGFAGWFTNTGNIALRVESGATALQVESAALALDVTGSGRIRSTAPITIAVSPLKMTSAWESIGDVEFLSDGAYLEVRPVNSGFQYVHIPVDLPGVLFGTPTRLKSIRVCYKNDQAASFVSTTIVSQGTDSGTLSNFINDVTDRTSTSWECYTVTDATPNAITGSVHIQLTLNFAGTGSAHDIRIGNIALTLVE